MASTGGPSPASERPSEAGSSEPAAPSRSATPWILGCALLAVGLALILLSESVPARLERGATAPDFSVPALEDASPVRLTDQRGQVVLLNFWATWCKPCEDEMPAMERLYRQLRPDGFELLAVSVDKVAPEVAAFRDRMGITFPIALDTDESVSRLYQTTGYPESLLIDAEGRLVERYVGPREWDDAAYVSRIRELLAEAREG